MQCCRVAFVFRHLFAPEQPSRERLHLVCLSAFVLSWLTNKWNSNILSYLTLKGCLSESYLLCIVAAGTRGVLDQQGARRYSGAISNSKLFSNFSSPKLNASMITGNFIWLFSRFFYIDPLIFWNISVLIWSIVLY